MGRGRPKKTPSDSLLTLPVGAEAELRGNDPGFAGSFYEVTITGHLVSSASYTVAYTTLVADDDGGPLEETAAAADVRPRPPPSARRGFAVHDTVEAFHDEGWWAGVVSAVPGPGPRVYEVTFPTSRETMEFEETALRPHRVFQAGQWVPAAEAVLDDGSALFREGSQVEVRRYGKSFGESWSPASVLKVIGATNFLVQYMHIGSDRELATEIIAVQYIRPAQTFRKYRFSRSSHVEVMHEDSWRPGVLRDILGSGIDKKYVVKLKSCETDMEDVECLDVLTVENTHIRPKFHWNGKKWVRCLDQDDGSALFQEGTQVEVRRSGKSFGESWSPASVLKVIGATKFLVQYMHIASDGELATEIIAAQYIRPAQTFRKYRFSQSFHVEVMHEHSWWPGVLLDVLGSGINKKYVVKLKSYETDMEDVECLDVLTVENTHPKEVIAANCIEEARKIVSMSEDRSQHTVSQQGRGSAMDSESLAIQHLLSFGKTSPVWARIDAMEIFSEMPQRPNLNQFQQHGPELREGMALGLMLSFANLAESICRLDVHQVDIGVLEEKEQGLSLLEENGFDVRVLRSRLEALMRTT
ncbi:hypothetical protein QYE76_000532 [Lolium multiflorum]|uniref:Agenet domain-containing protein n=1 Tax=Lolium multiflorum TaxID=4521 RepID=A0AAD8RLB1_LOLMU|nr:hypothetical protein QYE76_000532 [Lolium multiflorum]